MKVSTYDEAIDKEYGQKENKDPYDQIIDKEVSTQKAQLQETVKVQTSKQPQKAAEVYNLSKEYKLPSHAVERNLDKIKTKKKLDSFNYDELLEVNPGLSRWLGDADHAAVAHDELEPLKRLDSAARKIKPNKKDERFTKSLDKAFESGWHGLVSSSTFLAAAYGKVDIDTAANLISGANIKQRRVRETRPKFAKEFEEATTKEFTDVDERVEGLGRAWQAAKDGEILTALKGLAVDGTMTVAESIDLLATAVSRPRGLVYASAESAANSIPSILTGVAGAKIGTLTGAGIGSTVPVLGTTVGGSVGGIAGFVGGSFLGGVPTEIGASIMEDLSSKGYDLSNPEVVKRVLQDKELMKSTIDRAERKGVTTAGLDAVVNLFAGKTLAGIKGANKGIKGALQTAKAGAKDIAKDAAGEAAGELAGQIAKEEGDISKVSVGQSLFEGAVSLGSSISDVTIGAATRAKYSEDTQTATKEVVEDAQNALASLEEHESLRELGAAVKEAKSTATANGAIKELVAANDSIDETSAVFFQSDDWDSYWSERGESPVKKAYEISEEVGKSYAQSAATGSDLEIPMSDYAETIGKSEDFEGLLDKAKTRADGMKYEDAQATVSELPGLLKKLTEEAESLVDEDFNESVSEVRSRVKDQLQLAGFSAKDADVQAQLYEGRIKNRAMLRGRDPLQVFKDQNLSIKRQGQAIVRDNKTYDEIMKNRKAQRKENQANGITEKEVSSLKGEVRQFAEDWIDAEIEQMQYEIQQSEAGQRSGFERVIKDGQGGGEKINVSTSTKSTFPAWYSSLKLKNKDQFSSVTTKKKGRAYNRLRDIAIERLKNGYDNQHSGQVMPNNEFRAVVGLPNISETGLVESEDFTLFQSAGGPKGQIKIGENSFSIELLAKADTSTFLHETGHLWLEEIKEDVMYVNAIDDSQLSETQRSFKQDVDTILEHLGVDSIHKIEREHHELWARSVEAYLMEGKAPTEALSKAFARFKVWLTAVYRKIRNLNAPINDDLRGVMDRLIATETEIEEAKRANHVKDITNPDLRSKLEKNKLKRYEEMRDLFDRDSKEKMQSRLLKSFKKERELFISEEAKKEQARIESFLAEQRPYKAIDIIRNGEAGGQQVKIDRSELEALIGETGIAELPKWLHTKKDGMIGSVVADICGYENVTEMINEIKSTPPLKERAKAMAQKKMQEKYQDSLIDQTELEELAQKFVHSDRRGELLLMELSLLNDADTAALKEGARRATRRIPSNDEMKREAKSIISGVKVKKLRPHLYQAAEVREARKVEEHISKGEYGEAFAAKQKELLNHQLYREAIAARDAKNKAIKNFKKLKQKDSKLAKTRDMTFIDAARSILSRYGLSNIPKDSVANLELIKEYDPDVYDMVRGIVDSIKIDKADFREFTIAEFEELNDTFNALWDLSKSTRQIEIDGKKRDIKEVAEDLSKKLDRFNKPFARKKYAGSQTMWEGFKEGLLTLKSRFRRLEHWVDGMDLSDPERLFRKVFFQGVSDATDTYYEVKTEYNKRIVEMASKVAVDDKEIYSKDFDVTFKNKGEVLGAMLHVGNESNFKKLLVGRGWGNLNEDGTLNTSKWDSFMKEMHDKEIITKQDWDFIQGLWDLMEEVKPRAQKAHKEIFGHYFSEITSNPVETPFGTYRGGYAPAKVDYTEVRDAARRDEAKEFVEDNITYSFPGSGGNGFSKSRESGYNRPLSLNINLVTNHVDDVLRFAIVKPEVVKAAKIATSKEFRAAMDDLDPAIVDGMLKPALIRADKNRRSDVSPNSVNILNRAASHVKKAISANIMFMNIVNTVEQFTGFMAAHTQLSYKALYSGSVFYLRDAKNVSKMIEEKSTFMRTKTDENMFEFQKKANNLFNTSLNSKVSEFVDKKTYIAQSVTQDFIDKMVWIASYNDSIEKGASEKDAIMSADSLIRTTQNGNRPLDLASFQGNGLLSVVQMFSGYFNMVANLNATNFKKLYYSDMQGKEKFMKGLDLYWSGYASLAIFSAILRKGAAGGLDEDEDGEYLDDIYQVLVSSQIEFGLAMFPLLGSAINAGLNRDNDKFYDDRMSASPVFEAVSVAIDYGVPDVFSDKDAFERANVRDALTAIGVVSGIPLRPLAKPYHYLRDVNQGKADPSGPIDFTRGIITGKPGVNN